jgi:ATP-dependent helicase/nuclease subunit B
MRLDRVIAAARLDSPWHERLSPWLALATAVTRPDSIAPWPAPEPCPPVDVRPRKLSVTRVEDWMRDPYGIYARFILDLEALPPLEAEPGPADYGTLIHRALQLFAERVVRTAPEDYAHVLNEIGTALWRDATLRPAVKAFWAPRFQRIARWIAVTERERRANLAESHAEVGGEMILEGPAGRFVLTAKADRIDLLRTGTVAIVDYKTGTPPKTNVIEAGFAPQLPLEAAILLAGGFRELAPPRRLELAFWHLHGRGEGADIVPVTDDGLKLAAEARAGLERLIAAFDDPITTYRARPHPDFAPRYSDYAHLARVKEWAQADANES